MIYIYRKTKIKDGIEISIFEHKYLGERAKEKATARYNGGVELEKEYCKLYHGTVFQVSIRE